MNLEIKELGIVKHEKSGVEDVSFEVRQKDSQGKICPNPIAVAGMIAKDFREPISPFMEKYLQWSFETHLKSSPDCFAFIYHVPEKARWQVFKPTK